MYLYFIHSYTPYFLFFASLLSFLSGGRRAKEKRKKKEESNAKTIFSYLLGGSHIGGEIYQRDWTKKGRRRGGMKEKKCTAEKQAAAAATYYRASLFPSLLFHLSYEAN